MLVLALPNGLRPAACVLVGEAALECSLGLQVLLRATGLLGMPHSAAARALLVVTLLYHRDTGRTIVDNKSQEVRQSQTTRAKKAHSVHEQQHR